MDPETQAFSFQIHNTIIQHSGFNSVAELDAVNPWALFVIYSVHVQFLQVLVKDCVGFLCKTLTVVNVTHVNFFVVLWRFVGVFFLLRGYVLGLVLFVVFFGG